MQNKARNQPKILPIESADMCWFSINTGDECIGEYADNPVDACVNLILKFILINKRLQI